MTTLRALLAAAFLVVSFGVALAKLPPPPPMDEKGKATAYLCVGEMCNRPTTDPAGLEKQLKVISYRW